MFFWLWKESFKWKKLVSANVDLVAFAEAGSNHSFCHFDGKVDLVDRTENLVDFTDGGFVFEVDGRVKIGNLVF